jgi:hypothetical protein
VYRIRSFPLSALATHRDAFGEVSRLVDVLGRERKLMVAGVTVTLDPIERSLRVPTYTGFWPKKAACVPGGFLLLYASESFALCVQIPDLCVRLQKKASRCRGS